MTLRKIDIEGQDPVSTIDPGPLPKVILVNLDDLAIDETYQRPLSKSNWAVIRKIAARFSWSRFQPIMVSPVPGGGYAVIDGQHRAHAAALAGQVAVPASVVAIPRNDQAAAFAEINSTRTGITQFHLLKPGLAAGETWAQDCVRAVEAGGCRLMTSNRSAAMRKPRDVFALGLVRDHVERGRGGLVSFGLTAITGSDNRDAVGFYREGFLRALFAVLRDHPDFLYLDLSRVLGLLRLDQFYKDVEQLRARPDWAGKTQARCRVEVLRRYFAQAQDRGMTPKPERRAAPKPAPAAIKTPVRQSAPAKMRFAAKPCAVDDPAPRNPAWPEDRDAAVIASGGKYAKITELAEKWDMPIATVQARWHRLRAA